MARTSRFRAVALLVATGAAALLPPATAGADADPDELRRYGGAIARETCASVFVRGEHFRRYTRPRFLREAVGDHDETFTLDRARVAVDRARRRVVVAVGDPAPTRVAQFQRGYGCVVLPTGQDRLELPPRPRVRPRPETCPRPHRRCEFPRGERVSTPRADGVDSAALGRTLRHRVRDGKTLGVAVVHRGRLVGEEYAEGFSSDSVFRVWSVSKSITATLVGRMLQQGLVFLDQPVPLPEMRTATNGLERVTVRHLLRQIGGTACGREHDDYIPIEEGGPVIPPYVEQGLAVEPGTQWYYNQACSHLLLEAMARHVLEREGLDYASYLQRELFDPLGVRDVRRGFSDTTGLHLANTGYQPRVRDLARLGLLWLEDGVWYGRRLLPAGWLAEAQRGNPEPDGGWYGEGGCREVYSLSVYTSSPQPGCVFWPTMGAGDFAFLGANHNAVAVFPSRETVIVRVGFDVPGVFEAPAENVQDRIFAEVLEHIG